MKRLFFISLLALLSLPTIHTMAQNTKEEKKAAKEIRRSERATWEKEAFEVAKQAILNKEFVIEVDQYIFPKGYVQNVSSMTNFISMNDNKASVQLAVSNHAPGFNGLGGITVDGSVSNIEQKTLKHGIFVYKFSVIGVAISATVEIQLRGDGSNVSATIYPNFNNNNLTVRGKLVPLKKSIIFKGTSI